MHSQKTDFQPTTQLPPLVGGKSAPQRDGVRPTALPSIVFNFFERPKGIAHGIHGKRAEKGQGQKQKRKNILAFGGRSRAKGQIPGKACPQSVIFLDEVRQSTADPTPLAQHLWPNTLDPTLTAHTYIHTYIHTHTHTHAQKRKRDLQHPRSMFPSIQNHGLRVPGISLPGMPRDRVQPPRHTLYSTTQTEPFLSRPCPETAVHTRFHRLRRNHS